MAHEPARFHRVVRAEPVVAIGIPCGQLLVERVELLIQFIRVQVVEITSEHERIAVVRIEFTLDEAVERSDRTLHQHVLADHDPVGTQYGILDPLVQEVVHLDRPANGAIHTLTGHTDIAAILKHFVAEQEVRIRLENSDADRRRHDGAGGCIQLERNDHAIIQDHRIGVLEQVGIMDRVHQSLTRRSGNAVAGRIENGDHAIRGTRGTEPEIFSERLVDHTLFTMKRAASRAQASRGEHEPALGSRQLRDTWSDDWAVRMLPWATTAIVAARAPKMTRNIIASTEATPRRRSGKHD